MAKDFIPWYNARDGRFDVGISRTTSGLDSGRGWYIENVSADKQAQVLAEILDIISAIDGQSDFDSAEKLMNRKFRELCEKHGCPLPS